MRYHKTLWTCLLVALCAVSTAALLAAAREPQATGPPRDRPKGERVRGADADAQFDRQRRPDEREGTEEGMPAMGPGADRQRFWPVPRWRLGVYAYNTSTGVRITRVIPNSPAERAGFERGDTIVTVAGYQVGYVNGYVYHLGRELQLRADPHGHVRLLAQNWRDDRLLNVDVRLERWRHRYLPYGERPDRPPGRPQ